MVLIYAQTHPATVCSTYFPTFTSTDETTYFSAIDATHFATCGQTVKSAIAATVTATITATVFTAIISARKPSINTTDALPDVPAKSNTYGPTNFASVSFANCTTVGSAFTFSHVSPDDPAL